MVIVLVAVELGFLPLPVSVVIIGCMRCTKLCWVGKHMNVSMKPTFAIYQIMLGWKTYECYYDTDELPNPRPTQPSAFPRSK